MISSGAPGVLPQSDREATKPHGIIVQPIAHIFMVDGEALLKQIVDAIRERDASRGN
jgi:hypothetical protein